MVARWVKRSAGTLVNRWAELRARKTAESTASLLVAWMDVHWVDMMGLLLAAPLGDPMAGNLAAL